MFRYALLIWFLLTLPLAAVDLKDYAPSSDYTEHSVYLVKFNAATGTPLWTVHQVRKKATSEATRQGLSWRKDPLIPESLSGVCYRGLDYDAGHFVPADDVDTDVASLKETFYTSNCAPQNKSLNRGAWRKLETLIRTLAEKHDIVVITGAVYPAKFQEAPVTPLCFFKVIYMDGLVVCFLFKNEDYEGDINDAVVSLKSLEKATGLSFKRKP